MREAALLLIFALHGCALVHERVAGSGDERPPYLRISYVFCFLSSCDAAIDAVSSADIVYVRCALANCNRRKAADDPAQAAR
jgi:hypothetical protein